VVVYDDVGGSVAARLWWLLRFFGHDAVAVLDGGVQAWGQPLDSDQVEPEPGTFEATDGDWSHVLTYPQMVARAPERILLDARAPERFRGEVEPVDPKAGHIPGARSACWQGNLNHELRLLSPDQLRRLYAGLGVTSADQVVAYCGSGVNASHILLALEVAGLGRGRLYEGSWSDWSSHPEAPIALGE